MKIKTSLFFLMLTIMNSIVSAEILDKDDKRSVQNNNTKDRQAFSEAVDFVDNIERKEDFVKTKLSLSLLVGGSLGSYSFQTIAPRTFGCIGALAGGYFYLLQRNIYYNKRVQEVTQEYLANP